MKVICEKCESVYKAESIKGMSCCPVCGAPFSEVGNIEPIAEKEKHTYYYYNLGGGGLTTTLYDDETPIYTFEAIDMKDAERQLKEVMPNSPLVNDNSPKKVCCPRCRSTEVQLVPRKYSLLTGFATNKFDRMCVRCQKRF